MCLCLYEYSNTCQMVHFFVTLLSDPIELTHILLTPPHFKFSVVVTEEQIPKKKTKHITLPIFEVLTVYIDKNTTLA